MNENPKSQFLKGCARTLVLKVLTERPMYGYEIAQELTRRSASIFELGQGTLYPMLYTLERKGLIQVAREAEAPESGRKRLYYEITPRGRAVLVEDLKIWDSIARGMEMVLSDEYAAG